MSCTHVRTSPVWHRDVLPEGWARYGLAHILAWFETKFASTPYNRVHLLKALTYFRDAEAQPMPDMLVPFEWPEVASYFLSEVPRVSRLI